MAGAGTPTALGPFIGGLNTKSDQSALADNELYVCENFEIDFDGSLRSRPSLLSAGADLPLADGSGQGMLLGFYTVANGTIYLIASDGNSTTRAFNGVSWSTITTAVSAVAITQFNGKLWLLSGVSSQKGGSWDGATYTADNNMPFGTTITSYRGILYIGAGLAHPYPGRLYYSGPITGTLWAASPNFVDVGYGDGEGIHALISINNTLLVMRSRSLWTYSWATSPSGASISPLNTAVGLDNSQAVTVLEGVVYFVYELKAYSFINGRAEQINERVPLLATDTSNFNPSQRICVSTFGNRVVFSFYDQMFVYSTETYTWSTWVTPVYGAVGKMYQRSGFRDRYPTVYTSVSKNVTASTGRTLRMLLMTEGVDASYGESFQCTAVTKVFDYGTTSQYKRLFWWGVDALFRSSMSGTVVPVTFAAAVSWGQLRGGSWAQALLNTWAQPANASVSITSNRGAVGTGPQRKFLKMSKSLRFRQAYYRVVFQTDGTSATAPVKVFGLTTFVRTGERVSKTVS